MEHGLEVGPSLSTGVVVWRGTRKAVGVLLNLLPQSKIYVKLDCKPLRMGVVNRE